MELVIHLDPQDFVFCLITFFFQVGIFVKVLGIKIEKTIFELRKDFNFVILGPLTLRPKPFDKLGRVSSGKLTLQMNDMICESKGGSVGAEGWLMKKLTVFLFLDLLMHAFT